MSFDDPGWGGDDQGAGGWGGGDDQPRPPRQRPGWLNVPTLGGIAAAVLIVVAIVLAVTLHHSSKKGTTATVAKTSRPAATSHPPTTASRTSAKPSPTVTGETIATYDAAADKVCSAHASAIAAANGGTLEAQYDALVDEFSDLEQLTSPAQETAKQEQWIQQLGDALTALTHGSESSYTTALQNANTTAATLGMSVCNNGY